MKIKQKNTLIGASFVALAATLWGFDGVFLTPKLSNLDVVFVVFILHFIPFLIMNLFFFKNYSYLTKFTKQDFLWFSLIALTGGAIGTIAIVKALFLVHFQQLSVIVLLQKLQPVFAVVLAFIILGERPQKKFYAFAILAIVASYFLTFGLNIPQFTNDNDHLYAILLSLLAAFSFGSSTVFSRKVLNKFPFQVSTFFRYGFSTLVLLFFFLFFGELNSFSLASQENWFYLLLISLTTGSGAIFIYYYGLRKIKASIATFAELMFPVSAIIFDYFLNGKLLSFVQWIAAAVLLFAILQISMPSKSKKK
jgi:drug/metabolite transporter (DMT)-like permease